MQQLFAWELFGDPTLSVDNAFGRLQGDWYVNGVHITSSSQVVYVSSLDVSFRFTPSAAFDPAKVWAKVVEGTRETLLTYNAGSYTGTVTFTGGRHEVTVIASDGASPPVTFSISFR
jgi:hypothetical protein